MWVLYLCIASWNMCNVMYEFEYVSAEICVAESKRLLKDNPHVTYAACVETPREDS